MMNPPFVKKFDFRGVYGKDILNSDAFYLAQAIYKVFSLKKILLAWDTRESSRNLAMNFIQSLSGKNIEIHYMEKCSIDYLTVGANIFNYDVSIMFTGSHNPWTWSGLLIHENGGRSISNELVIKLIKNFNAIEKNPYKEEKINLSDYKNVTEAIEQKLTEKIQSLFPISHIKPFSLLVDTGDGSGSRSLSLLEKLIPQIKITSLHTRNVYDGKSPHIADPSEISNVSDVLEEMQKKSYDAAFIFDSDADRVLATDENGNYVNGSILGSVHFETFQALKIPVQNIGYAVDCAVSIPNTVRGVSTNMEAHAIPVGRSLVRNKLQENLDIGIENVGHFYTKSFFMTDSAFFSMFVILYWMSEYGKLSQVFTMYPDGEREQIFLDVLSEEKTNSLCKKINEHFETLRMNKITVDGIRFEFFQEEKLITWYTIRNSGYEKITKCYYGSLDNNDFTILDNIFRTVSLKT